MNFTKLITAIKAVSKPSRVIIRELNLDVVTKAAKEEQEARVVELIEALYEGIAG